MADALFAVDVPGPLCQRERESILNRCAKRTATTLIASAGGFLPFALLFLELLLRNILAFFDDFNRFGDHVAIFAQARPLPKLVSSICFSLIDHCRTSDDESRDPIGIGPRKSERFLPKRICRCGREQSRRTEKREPQKNCPF